MVRWFRLVTACLKTLEIVLKSDGHYDILEDYTITLCPENPGEKLNIDFEEFFLGPSGISKMFLYDGDSTTAEPITIFPKPRTANYFTEK